MGELHDALEQIIKETPRRLLEEHIAKKLGGAVSPDTVRRITDHLMAGGTVRSVCEEIGLPIKFDEDDIAQRAVNENLEGLHQRTLSLTQSVARSMARKLNREWSKEETNEEDFARVWQSAGERHSTCALTPHAFIGVWLRNPRERRAIDV